MRLEEVEAILRAPPGNYVTQQELLFIDLEEPEEARRALDRARFVLERPAPLCQALTLFGGGLNSPLTAAASAASRTAPPGWDWPTQLEVRLFRRAAQTLLESPPARPQP